VRQTSLAPGLRTESPSSDASAEREVSADELRSILGAFQRGLDRGRKGIPTSTAPTERAEPPTEPTETEEGTDSHDAP
jgi:hypothetical protein